MLLVLVYQTRPLSLGLNSPTPPSASGEERRQSNSIDYASIVARTKHTFLISVNEALSAYAHNCTLGLSLQQQEFSANKR